MPRGEQKLDSGLSHAYRAWREDGASVLDAGMSVNLLFQGDLSAIEALGFEVHSIFRNQAMGVIRFKDVEKIAAQPDVLRIASGRADEAYLDTAVRDIKARASAPIAGLPVDGLWHADAKQPVLTSVAKATGKGVLVAIIDTGIDYTHPMFLSQLTPTKKTRILRIWDQGLTPAVVGDCPDVSLIGSLNTFGVEFDSNEIEAALNGGKEIDHRDCHGHGTHVAGIAAGGLTFSRIGGDASKVGVAPEADIIAVKFLDTPDKIFYTTPDGSVGVEVGQTARFRDAVLYCLRTANRLNKPVVINMSFGDVADPGDGLDEDSQWLDGVMDPNHAPGVNNFPQGSIIIKAAGNSGEDLMRIVVPASGEITVPLLLADSRGTAQTNWQHCRNEHYAPDIGMHFWYRRPAVPLAVSFAVQLPHNPTFSAEVSAGGKLQLGFKPMVGPPPVDTLVVFAPKAHAITIDHQDIPPVPHPAGGTVWRSHVKVFVSAKQSGGTISYHTGVYQLRIKAPAGTVFFGMEAPKYWGSSGAILRLDDSLPPPPEIIMPSEESSIADPLGQHVITVASYTDLPNPFSPAHGISDFSSRGPLRDFSDPPRPPFCNKPDISAPGEGINSAQSIFAEGQGLFHWIWTRLGGERFQELSGTSMASPMVAGVVALMLEKNPNLNIAEVRSALSSAPRAAVQPAAPPASANAYGVGMVDAMASHTVTPP